VMAEWVISSDSVVEDGHRARLGDAEYDRRVAVAEKKTGRLGYGVGIVYGPQIKQIMLLSSAETFGKMCKSSPNLLVNLVDKVSRD